ncbi:MarR family winged helix-turn-helix transcriptional regulator [uncultured Methanobrevibacter sp.]|uniref:MarR family winged helix-turn-helix transcriptional regulator n=1 Tax=uncultured Methanobrevibacter sp. TaxID=253161 RepID=UPI0015BB950E|nr:MarR family transcriptional regulator [uncultured Methanobrevibacter sp.]
MEDKKLGFLISNIFNDYTNYMNSYLEKMDLTLSQTRVLLVLALNNGVSIDFLAEKSNIGKSSVTKSVKILEKKGFLTKDINPEDNRKKIVKITNKGRNIQKEALKINNEIEESIVSAIGEEEIKILKKQLMTLDDLIKKIR